MKDEMMTLGFAEPEEAILPDGWKEGDDLFADSVEPEKTADELVTDGGEIIEPEQAESKAEEEEDLEALIMGEEKKSEEGPSAEVTPEETPADEEEKAPEKAPRILNLKVNHKEESLNLDEMSDDDLVALLQKGRAFDSMKDAENKRKFREKYHEQLEAGMTDDLARLAASAAVGGKSYSLTDDEDFVTEEPAQASAPKTSFAPETIDLDVAAKQIKVLYPDFDKWPVDVIEAIKLGAAPLAAYQAYHEREGYNKTVADLRKENAVLKQNAASAAKAPVRGVSGGGDVTPKKRDYFEEGFDSDDWSRR